MADIVTIGGISLSEWEIPSTINFGGQQQLVVHKLIGGQRIVDAMGPDPENITWQGRFRGADALARAQALDALRQAGGAIPLTWGGLFYTVVIQRFHADYQKGWEIPYSIECVVSDDPLGSIAGGIASTLGGLISADFGQVSGFIGGVIGDLGF